MVTEQLKKERTLIRGFANKHKTKAVWGFLYTNDYIKSCSLKIQMCTNAGFGYKELLEFCSGNGIEGFEECPNSFGIYKKYEK
jgi:hypothetical protein